MANAERGEICKDCRKFEESTSIGGLTFGIGIRGCSAGMRNGGTVSENLPCEVSHEFQQTPDMKPQPDPAQ